MSRIEQNMVAENIADITSGIHGLAERVAYRYAAIERRHRFRFLFDPLRMLEQTDFIQRYLAGGGRTSGNMCQTDSGSPVMLILCALAWQASTTRWFC